MRRHSALDKNRLGDIDWRQGTATLKRTWSRRQNLLPLPMTTGLALEAYLRHERPKTSDLAVFVRRLAAPTGRVTHGLR